MLRNLKPLLLMQTRQPQLRTSRPMLRYPVSITLQIAIQRSNTLPEPLPQPVEETMDLLTEYRWVTRLMTLGTMNSHTHEHTHTHNIVPWLALRTWNNHPHRGREQPHRQNNKYKCANWKCTIPTTLGQSTVWKAHMQPTGASCQSLPQITTQVSNTVDLYTDVVLV